MKLQTTDTDLHEIEKALDASRESSSTIKLPKDAIRRLVSDHLDLIAVAKKRGAGIVAGEDQRSLT